MKNGVKELKPTGIYSGLKDDVVTLAMSNNESIVYNIKLISNPEIARNIAVNIAGRMFENTQKAGDRAYNGDDRYYEIVTDEPVEDEVKTAGYIKVHENADEPGKLKFMLTIEGSINSDNNFSLGEVLDSIRLKVEDMLEKAESRE